MRIVAFVGSPVQVDDKELVKLAKRLKKEKVNVDIVSFGEESSNNDVLSAFISTLNGKDGTSSHLLTVPPGPHLSDALISSPIIQGEDGGAGMGTAAFEFGVDPNEDPELALALRVSMEEQRQRQEDEARRAGAETADTTGNKDDTSKEIPTEEAMLKRALAMSLEADETAVKVSEPTPGSVPDFSNMTEEEQIAFAMQMSMQDQQESEPQKEEPMEVEEDLTTVMSDTAFLQSVLENLPGVDPQSEAVRQAVGSLQKDKEKDKKKDKDSKK